MYRGSLFVSGMGGTIGVNLSSRLELLCSKVTAEADSSLRSE